MKKLLLALAVLTVVGLVTPAPARAHFSLSIGVPGFGLFINDPFPYPAYPPVYYGPPVYYPPAPYYYPGPRYYPRYYHGAGYRHGGYRYGGYRYGGYRYGRNYRHRGWH